MCDLKDIYFSRKLMPKKRFHEKCTAKNNLSEKCVPFTPKNIFFIFHSIFPICVSTFNELYALNNCSHKCLKMIINLRDIDKMQFKIFGNQINYTDFSINKLIKHIT